MTIRVVLGVEMDTKHKKEAKMTLETGVNILPVEDWAEDIASRKPRPHVIQDLLPSKRGEYMAIAGRTGIGKTNLALHLGFCLATGTPFFGLECRKMRVAFLEFEGDEANIKDRYDKLKLKLPLTKGRLFFGMMPLSNPKHMLEAVLNGAEGCKILILDPVKYLVSGDYLKPNTMCRDKCKRVCSIVTRVLLSLFVATIILFLLASFLFTEQVMKDPSGFLQGVIVASTALIGFTGVFLTSRPYEEARPVRIIRSSRNLFLFSIFLGLMAVGFALAWFTGFLFDPYLDPEKFTPKFVEVLFLVQIFFVWTGFTIKYFTR